MEKITNLLETANEYNITIDTNTLGYYWYKIELMGNIFSVFIVLIVVVCVCLFTYYLFKSYD